MGKGSEMDECLLSFLKPVYFDTILEATKSLASYGFRQGAPLEMKTPSLGLKMGYALINVTNLEGPCTEVNG